LGRGVFGFWGFWGGRYWGTVKGAANSYREPSTRKKAPEIEKQTGTGVEKQAKAKGVTKPVQA